MWGTLIQGLLGLAVLSIIGLLVVALAPAREASQNAIAAPIIGVVAVSLFHAAVGAIFPTRVSTVILIAAVLAGFVRVARSRRSEFADALTRLRGAPLLLAMGLPALIFGSAVFADGPALVRTGQTFDVYAFVAAADWVDNHRYTDLPIASEDPPGDLYAAGHLAADLRLGNEQTITSLAFLLGGLDEMQLMQAVQGLWIILLALGAGTLALSLGTGHRRAAVVAMVIPLSPLLIAQLFDQNVASLLGIAAGLCTVGAVHLSLVRPSRANGLIAGFFLAGLAAIYSELLILVLPVVTILFLWTLTAAKSRLDCWRWLTGAVTATVVVGLVPWYRTVLSMSGHASRGRDIPGYLSPFDPTHSSVATVAARVIGEHGYFEGNGISSVGIALIVLMLIGIVAALLTPASRKAALAVVVAWVAVVFLLTARSGLQYPQFRAIEFTTPFLLTISVIGLMLLTSHISWPLLGEGALFAVSLAVVLLWAETLASLNSRADDFRTSVPLDGVAQAESWIESVGAENVLIIESEVEHQLALIHNLKDHPGIAYAALEPSYVGKPSESHWNGERRSYLLVGRSELRSSDTASPVESNQLFEFYRSTDLDLSILAFTAMRATASGIAISAAQTGDRYYLYPLDFTRSEATGVFEVSATCGAAPGWLRIDGDQVTADVLGVALTEAEHSPRPKYAIALDLSSCWFPRLELGATN